MLESKAYERLSCKSLFIVDDNNQAIAHVSSENGVPTISVSGSRRFTIYNDFLRVHINNDTHKDIPFRSM